MPTTYNYNFGTGWEERKRERVIITALHPRDPREPSLVAFLWRGRLRLWLFVSRGGVVQRSIGFQWGGRLGCLHRR
jgi:hypothetical protein